MSLYLDVDNRGTYSIHDITECDLNTILMALTNFQDPVNKASERLSREIGMHLHLQLNKLETNGQPDQIQDGKS